MNVFCLFATFFAAFIGQTLSYTCETVTNSYYSYNCPSDALATLSTSTLLRLNLDAAKYTATSSTWTDLTTSDGSTDAATKYGTTSAATYTTESNTYFFDFDGSSDYMPVNLYYSASQTITAITIGAWYRSTLIDLSVAVNTNWAIYDHDQFKFFSFYVAPSGYLVFTFTQSTDSTRYDIEEDSSIYSSLSATDPDWHYLSATFGCTTSSICYAKVYRDGLDSTISSLASTTYSSIGSSTVRRYGVIGDSSKSNNYDGTRGGYYSDIQLAMLHTYDDDLSASNIQDIYDSTKKFFQTCAAGYYCDYGYFTYACPAGSYCPGDWTSHYCGEGLSLPNSVYCPGGLSQIAATTVSSGYYSLGLTSVNRTSQLVCPEGYYCSSGEKYECGSNAVYCPLGSSAAIAVSTGYYSTGSSSTTRTGQIICAKGNYCLLGVSYECAAGTYGSSLGLSESTCSGECLAGYYCPVASSSSQQENCASDSIDSYLAASYYCSLGATARLQVTSNDMYTGPETSSIRNREYAESCPSNSFCAYGLRAAILEFGGSCNDGSMSVSYDENQAANQFLTMLNVTNYNLSTNVLFSIDSVLFTYNSALASTLNESEIYEIDVYTTTSYNRELQSSYDFTMYAVHEVDSAVNASCTVNVAVADLNDRPVMLEDQAFNVSEGSEVNTAVNGGQVMASDEDATDSLLFAIVSVDPVGAEDYFSIGACSGVIYISKAGLKFNDFPLVFLNITVTDDDAVDPLMDYSIINMTVLDTNDSPLFTMDQFTFTVNESLAIGSIIGQVFSTDEDIGDTVTYTILLNDGDLASFDESYLVLDQSLDFEVKEYYSLTILVTDSENAYDTATVIINVENVNEAPVVTAAQVSVYELETVGTEITVYYTISDPDSTSFTYAQLTTSTVFSTDSSTGYIQLLSDLDYETLSSYEITVSVTDDGGEFDSVTLSISIIDENEAPVVYATGYDLTNPTTLTSTFVVYENVTTGTAVMKVRAYDQDDGQLHKLSVISDATTYFSNVISGFFELDEAMTSELSDSNGLSIKTTKSVDYESFPSEFNITFKVLDSIGLFDTGEISIQIIDCNDQPSADSSMIFSVSENYVGLVGVIDEITDQDSSTSGNGQLSFSVTFASTDVDDFQLVLLPDMQSANLLLLSSLDYETVSLVTIEVTATDAGSPPKSASISIEIEVTNANDGPQITNEQATFSISQSITPSTLYPVGIIYASDDDGDDLTYHLIQYYAVSVSTTALELAVDENTGYVYGSSSSSFLASDMVYNVSVNVSDGIAKDSSWYLVVVSSANSPPEMIGATNQFSVADEGSGDASAIPLGGTFEVYDANDATLTYDASSCLVNSTTISCGSSLLADFTVTETSSSGNSHFVQVYFQKSESSGLDYESSKFDSVASSVHSIILYISAYDSEAFTFMTLYVTISDVNESPSSSDGVLIIDENNDEGTMISNLFVDLGVSDPDLNNENAAIMYYFTSTGSVYMNPFFINSTGFLFASESLNFEVKSTYSFDVTIEDNGDSTSVSSVKVFVQDVEEDPYFSSDIYYASLSELESVGATVLDIEADDEDGAEVLSYSIQSGDTSMFSIDSSGTIYLIDDLDFETTSEYSLSIQVSDSYNNIDTATVNISIINEPDSYISQITPNLFNTSGNTLVALDGMDFVSSWINPSSYSISASYRSSLDDVVYQANNCNISVSPYVGYQRVECFTVEGVGKYHSWNLTVSSNSSYYSIGSLDDVTSSYLEPSIYRVEMNESVNTTGGALVTLFGWNFGPSYGYILDGQTALAQVAVVSLGVTSDADNFDCVNPKVFSHNYITCFMPEGYGSSLHFMVGIGALPHTSLASWTQYSDSFQSDISYNNPFVSTITADPLDNDGRGLNNFTTEGGDYFTVTGFNFGTDSDLIEVSYNGSLAYGYVATDCMITVSHFEVKCKTAPGIGKDYLVRVKAFDLESSWSVMKLSYTSPTIVPRTIYGAAVSGRGSSGASTQGGQILLIYGNEFGSESDPNNVPSITYGPTGIEYDGSDCEISVSYSQVTCLTGSGTGKGLFLTIIIGGQASEVYNANISYAQPTVSGFLTQWNYGANTEGLQWLYIEGSNFGTVAENAVNFVGYGQNGLVDFVICSTEYVYGGDDLCSCQVVTDHEAINCTTVEGAGLELNVILKIHDQISTSPYISYAPPVITSLTGDGVQDGIMGGSEYVTLIGSNFGPEESYIDFVTYGPGGDEYEAANCTLVSHEEITCLTAAGVGQDLTWKLSIRGQISEVSEATTSYGTPTIDSITPSEVVTDGGETVTLYGQFFGQDVQAAYFQILMDGETIMIDGGSTDKIYTVNSLGYSGTDEESGLEYVKFVTPELSESLMDDHSKEIMVLVGHGIYDGTEVTSTNFETLIYESPLITELASVAGNYLGGLATTDLILYGENFGTTGKLLIDGEFYDYPDNCDNDESFCYWSHSRIQMNVFGTSGTVSVVVGDVQSAFETFDSDSPVLVVDYNNEQNYYFNISLRKFETSGYDYYADSEDQYTITFLGVNFQSDETRVEVKIDNTLCPIVSGSLELYTDEVEGVNEDDVRTFSCTVPAGTGLKNRVIVTRSGTVAVHGDGTAAQEMTLSYYGPIIEEVYPSRIPTTGGLVTITGYDFGSDSFNTTYAYFDSAAIEVVSCNYSQIVLSVPSGEGTFKILEIDVDGQFDSVTGVESVGFSEPTVSNVDPSSIPTDGGYITITGQNFGREGHLEAFVDGMSVPVTDQDDVDHSWVEIFIDEGEGKDLTLLLNVEGQSVESTISFLSPILDSVTPNQFTTRGGETVMLSGSNFGLGNETIIRVMSNSGTVSAEFAGNSANVATYNHTHIEFSLPSSDPQSVDQVLLLVVDGQESNYLTVSFYPPVISYLSVPAALDIDIIEFCSQFISECPLSTDGDYSLVLVGENFGVTNQEVLFFEASTDSSVIVDHLSLSFEVPAGVGAGITVSVIVGGQSSNTVYFSYAKPVISSVSPSVADATGDIIEISGTNFGPSSSTADPKIIVNNAECTNVLINNVAVDIWQTDSDGTPYLWCLLPEMTVGQKSITVEIGGQNSTFSEDEELLSVQCFANYYGHEAYTYFINHHFECEKSCDDIVSPCILQNTTVIPACAYEEGAVICGYTTIPGIEDPVLCQALTKIDEECDACPSGSTCDAYQSIYAVEPIADKGFWRLEVSSTLSNCGASRVHRDFCYYVLPCTPNDACAGDNTCNEGYTGTKCSDCCDRYHEYIKNDNGDIVKVDGKKLLNEECIDEKGDQILFYRFNGDCAPCPDNPLLLFVLFIMAVTVIIFGGYYLSKKQLNLGIVAIGIDFFQVLSIFSQTNVEWPAYLQTLFQFMSLFSFNIGITAPECALSFSYELRWWCIEMAPIAVMLIFLTLFLSKSISNKISGNDKRKGNSHAHALIATSLMIFYYFYLFISSTTLEIFNCTPPVDEYGNEVGTTEYLEVAPDEPCYEEGSMQTRLIGPAVIFFMLYSVGYPAMIAFILLRPQGKHRAQDDQLLRAQGIGNDRKTNPYNYTFRKRYSRLYYHFKPKNWFWILVILARKFSLVTSALLFRENATFQLCVMILILFISYSLQVKYSPYMSNTEKQQVIKENQEKIKTQQDIVDARQKGVDGKSRQQIKLGDIDDMLKDRKDSVQLFIFNYNTVESILLFCLILVNLFGLMFDSAFLRSGGVSYNALLVTTLFFVISSITYYLVVVYYEIIIIAFPLLKCDLLCLMKKAEVKQDAKRRKSLSDASDSETVIPADMQLHQNPLLLNAHALMDKIGQSDDLVQTLIAEKTNLQTALRQTTQELQLIKKQMMHQRSETVGTTFRGARMKKKKSFMDDSIPVTTLEEIEMQGVSGDGEKKGKDEDVEI